MFLFGFYDAAMGETKLPRFGDGYVRSKIDFSSIRSLEAQLKELIDKKTVDEVHLETKQKEFESLKQEALRRAKDCQDKTNQQHEKNKQLMAEFKLILDDPNGDAGTKEIVKPMVADYEKAMNAPKPVDDALDDVIAFLEVEMINISATGDKDELIKIQKTLVEIQTAKEEAFFVSYADKSDIFKMNLLSMDIKAMVSELQKIEKDISLIHVGIDILKSIAENEKKSEITIVGKKRERSLTPNRDLFPPCNDPINNDVVKNDSYTSDLGGEQGKIRKIS